MNISLIEQRGFLLAFDGRDIAAITEWNRVFSYLLPANVAWKMESGLQSARTENVYFGRHRYIELAIAASREWNRIKFIEGIWLFRSCGYAIPFQPISFISKTSSVFLAPQPVNREFI